MGRIGNAIIEILWSLIFLLPTMIIWNRYYLNKTSRTCLYLVFASYLVAVYSLVGLPDILYLRFDFSYNFIPIVGMSEDMKNTILNVILFIPLGFLLPVCWDRYRKLKYTILFGFIITLLIEIMQIFTYRATDVNDILTNVSGTIVGYGIASILTKRFSKYKMENSDQHDAYLLCGIVFGIKFFCCPFISLLLN